MAVALEIFGGGVFEATSLGLDFALMDWLWVALVAEGACFGVGDNSLACSGSASRAGEGTRPACGSSVSGSSSGLEGAGPK